MNFEYSVVKGLADEYGYKDFSYTEKLTSWLQSKLHIVYLNNMAIS